MRTSLKTFAFVLFPAVISAQSLTVEKIMRDPAWIGTSPSALNWSHDGSRLYFQWNPEGAIADSLYMITTANRNPVKVSPPEKKRLSDLGNTVYNTARTAITWSSNGDIFYSELKTGTIKRILQSADRESNPQFSFNFGRIDPHQSADTTVQNLSSLRSLAGYKHINIQCRRLLLNSSAIRHHHLRTTKKRGKLAIL